MGITRKEVVFDLDTTNEGLRSHYPNPDNWRKAYSDIRQFMEKNGFEHQQGSAYISIMPLNKRKITNLINDMQRFMPWLPKCINALDIANIGEKISYLDEIKNISRMQQPKKIKDQRRTKDFGISM